MSSSIRMLSRIEPNKPILLAAWPGMGNVAFGAAIYLKESLVVSKFAEICPEDIFYQTGIQTKRQLKFNHNSISATWYTSCFFNSTSI